MEVHRSKPTPLNRTFDLEDSLAQLYARADVASDCPKGQEGSQSDPPWNLQTISAEGMLLASQQPLDFKYISDAGKCVNVYILDRSLSVNLGKVCSDADDNIL